MQTQISEPAKSFAERILTELGEVREEVRTLRRFAELLGLPPEGREESYMSATMRLLGLLVAGTEETHRRLEALHAAVIDPRLQAALRTSMEI